MTTKSKVVISSVVTISTMFLLAGFGTISKNPLAAGTLRQMENLGRGVVAVNQSNGNVFVSWRMLGTDPDNIAFNLYRVTGSGQPVKLNQEPITKATYYQDTGVDQTKDNAWFVRPIVKGAEGRMSKPFLNKIAANAPAQSFLELPLKLPENTRAGDGSVGDLDGDGEYEIVVKGEQRPRDTASAGLTGNTVLQAYKFDGTLLWTISMGKNIREGEHDTQFMVYDLDGDGRAEIAVRTADGTIDGTGKVIGDPGADWVDRDQNSRTFGKIMKGPEYFSIFNGQTGAEMARAEYSPTREPLDGWGGIGGNGGWEKTPTGNRMNRFLAYVAYLDGEQPSVIMCRGYYGRTVLAAWDWRNGKLTSRWVFDSSTHPNNGHPYVTTSSTVDAAAGLNKITDNAGSWDGAQPGEWMVWDREGVKEHRQVVAVKGQVLTVDENMTPGINKGAHVYGYSGMGNHNLSVADVDGDGQDEIVYGSMVVDDNGKGLFTNGLRHGDSLHVGDLDPGRPGLEVFGPHENEGGEYDKWTAGAALYDALTGKILWGTPDGQDVGGGVSGDVDPRYPGEEMWGIPGGLHSCKGEVISARGPEGGGNSSFVIWWDGDPLREVLAGNHISKWDWQNATSQIMLTAQGCAGGRPVLSGDLFGDWREEVVFRTTDSSALRIYTPTDRTEVRIYTLMHDPQYRLSIVWQNVAYNQPPHPSFFIGDGMQAPPKPNITLVKPRSSHSLGSNAAGAAERPWLQITEPSVAEVAAGFQTPPPENGMTLWWGWDGPVDHEVIKRDLDRIKGMGFTSVMIEAGNRMEQKYLTPGWFNLFKIAVDEAKARNMRVWVEDEGKYPSGFVGGKFTQERPDLRMQSLAAGERIDVAAGQTVTRAVKTDTICAVACNLDNNENRVLEIMAGEVAFTAPAQGRWQVRTVRHVFRSGPTAWVDNPTGARKDNSASLCDYMNPEATKQIIAWTHEGYRKAAGDEFGRTFMGFMGDEPAFTGTPWTPRMLEEFQKRKGYDIRPYLAWIVGSGSLPEEARRAKADYWDVWSDLFSQNYFQLLADWCSANNVEYIVHLDKDDSNPTLVRSGGDFFKNMRVVGIPGIDAIWAQIWFDHEADYPKMASSAAHLFGKPHAFSESFAAFTNPVDVPTAKWVIDYQLVRGINLIQVMFMSASSGGSRPLGGAPGATSGTPPAAARGQALPGGTPGGGRGPRFYASPEFPPMAGYVHRASYLLSMGRPAAQIGIYIPSTSLWLGDTAADTSNLAIAQKLLENQRDFDWVDEQALSSVLKLEGAELKNLSGQGYRAIIIPSISVISRTALDRLQAFAGAGGRVIFLGRTPSMVADKTFFKATAAPDLGWAMVEASGELTRRVMAALPKPDVMLDQACPAMKYVHRRWRDADLYFFFNERQEQQSAQAVLAGTGQAQLWDAASGRVESLAGATAASGAIRVLLNLGPHESRFIVVGPLASAAATR